jgi:hypothetical protein
MPPPSSLQGATPFYIHGKVVEADYGTKHGRIFIGSDFRNGKHWSSA